MRQKKMKQKQTAFNLDVALYVDSYLKENNKNFTDIMDNCYVLYKKHFGRFPEFVSDWIEPLEYSLLITIENIAKDQLPNTLECTALKTVFRLCENGNIKDDSIWVGNTLPKYIAKKTDEGDVEEVWCDIEGYDGKYQISNLGRVRELIVE